jgi:UDP-glucose 4-epimerase
VEILVTGAAGYIGSVVTEQLIEGGHQVIALDNLQHGHAAAMHPDAQFLQGDLLDAAWLTQCMQDQPIDAVVHLAAEALIDESVRDPGRFYRVNMCGGLNLLDAMIATGVKRMVFSSTAAVYGEPEHIPIKEDARQSPVNSYGESKLAFERALAWYHRAHGLKYVTMRYFNACGATERYGEFHRPETHLIAILLDVAMGHREAIQLYGTDYHTPDGTCIRDYIHVSDIAQAHLLALENLDHLQSAIFNIGNGAGYSNLQVIDTVRQVTGRDIHVVSSEQRPGDPARLVASSERIQRELGWVPRYPELAAMVESAWQWRQRHPTGYAQ